MRKLNITLKLSFDPAMLALTLQRVSLKCTLALC